MIAYLDTQVAAWLAAGDLASISRRAREAIEAHDLLVSPAVVLELEYLHEIKRIQERANESYALLHRTFGVTVCMYPFADIVLGVAVDEKWTRDPFDRLIVAHARANQKSPLISADRKIRTVYDKTIW